MNNQMKTVFHIQFEGNSDPITRKAYLQIERYWDIDLTRKMPGLFDQIKLAWKRGMLGIYSPHYFANLIKGN